MDSQNIYELVIWAERQQLDRIADQEIKVGVEKFNKIFLDAWNTTLNKHLAERKAANPEPPANTKHQTYNEQCKILIKYLRERILYLSEYTEAVKTALIQVPERMGLAEPGHYMILSTFEGKLEELNRKIQETANTKIEAEKLAAARGISVPELIDPLTHDIQDLRNQITELNQRRIEYKIALGTLAFRYNLVDEARNDKNCNVEIRESKHRIACLKFYLKNIPEPRYPTKLELNRIVIDVHDFVESKVSEVTDGFVNFISKSLPDDYMYLRFNIIYGKDVYYTLETEFVPEFQRIYNDDAAFDDTLATERWITF